MLRKTIMAIAVTGIVINEVLLHFLKIKSVKNIDHNKIDLFIKKRIIIICRMNKHIYLYYIEIIKFINFKLMNNNLTLVFQAFGRLLLRHCH